MPGFTDFSLGRGWGSSPRTRLIVGRASSSSSPSPFRPNTPVVEVGSRREPHTIGQRPEASRRQWRSQDFANGGAKEINARVSAREKLGCHAYFRSRDAGTPTFRQLAS